LLILARIVHLGFLADFLSRSVLVGFLTGVGLQVALGELPKLFGIKASGNNTLLKLNDAAGNLGTVSGYTTAVSLAVLVLIIGCRQLSKRIPGPLIAVVAVIVASSVFDLKSLGVGVLGNIDGELPRIGIPDVAWSWKLLWQLLPTALSIFMVILAQSAATSRAYAARYGEKFSENSDLVGLGLANLGAGISGTFVVNGSPTKTEMVDSAGGRSQLAQLTTAVIVLLTILFLTGPLALMPDAALSAIVFLIGINLIDLRNLRKIFAQARSEFWIAVATAAIVVVVGVEQGILWAMALSLINHTRRGYRPKNSVIVRSDGEGWHARPVSDPAEFEPGLLVYRFSHSMYYANTQVFQEEVTSLVNRVKPKVRCFCIDASAIDDVDYSAGQALKAMCNYLKERGIRLTFVMVEPSVKTELDKYGVSDLVGEDAFFDTGRELLQSFERMKKRPKKPDSSQ
ncbi:MAG: SulP family inorganic anion transporter, partial [Rhizobiaceae bacterium]